MTPKYRANSPIYTSLKPPSSRQYSGATFVSGVTAVSTHMRADISCPVLQMQMRERDTPRSSSSALVRCLCYESIVDSHKSSESCIADRLALQLSPDSVLEVLYILRGQGTNIITPCSRSTVLWLVHHELLHPPSVIKFMKKKNTKYIF